VGKRRDVTDAEMRLGHQGSRRLCPDCTGVIHWPWLACEQDEPHEEVVGVDDGVEEYVRECPLGGAGRKA
jgi:hypothetical protein